VTLDGRRVQVNKPRVRGVADQEMELRAYRAFATRDLLNEAALGRTLADLQTMPRYRCDCGPTDMAQSRQGPAEHPTVLEFLSRHSRVPGGRQTCSAAPAMTSIGAGHSTGSGQCAAPVRTHTAAHPPAIDARRYDVLESCLIARRSVSAQIEIPAGPVLSNLSKAGVAHRRPDAPFSTCHGECVARECRARASTHIADDE